MRRALKFYPSACHLKIPPVHGRASPSQRGGGTSAAARSDGGGAYKRSVLTPAIAALLALSLAGCAAPAKAPTNVSTMEGYVSIYNPGHIDSGEAWRIMQSNSDAIILDIRSKESYDERHVSGAVNVPFEALDSYAAANLGDKSQAIICYCFCGDKGGSALSAYNRLTELGYTNVSYTEPESEWTYEGTSQSTAPERKTVSGDEAKAIYDANPGAILLDVRSVEEYEEKHIEGSVLIPVSELSSRLGELPDKHALIIVYCKGGTRSETAYQILSAAGYTNVYDMQKVDNWPS